MAPSTPAAWLKLLEQKLAAQQREIQLYEDYYDGDHRLAYASMKFRQAFGYLFKTLSDNWCEIVVDTPVERLFVEGFRFGSTKPADSEAWEIWQANALDAESIMAHTEAVKDGRAYILVAPSTDGSEYPRITVEHPSQVVVSHAPGDRRIRNAALKKWRDEDGYVYATLYLPDQIVKWQSKRPLSADVGISTVEWVERTGDPGGRHDLGVVPVIPLSNNPTMLKGGRSDLKPAIPLNDAINKELADALVASEFAAYPQRVLMGVEIPTDSEGKPLPSSELKSSSSRVWAFENENAKVSQFAAADLGNYTNMIGMLLQHLAAQTRTPPHYLLGEIVNASGDALKAAETGLVAKVKRKQIDFSDSWEEAMRLALKLRGKKEPGEALGAETIWRDPEYRSEGEQVDAAIKLRGLSIPLQALWERIGATPQQVEDWEAKLDKQLVGPDGTPLTSGEPPAPTVSITERTTQ